MTESLHRAKNVALTDQQGDALDILDGRLPVVIASDTGNQLDINETGQAHVVQRGKIDSNNSSVSPLGIGIAFIGDATETLDYAIINITVFSDVASATDGLIIQQSNDPDASDSVWSRQQDPFTIPAGTGKVFSVQASMSYMRIVYTNGGVGQTEFELSTLLKKTNTKPSSHRIDDAIVSQDDAELVKAVLAGLSALSGGFENISTYRNALNVNSAWVHRKIVNETFHQHNGVTTTPSIAIAAGDVAMTLTSVVGLSVGDEIKLGEGSTQEIGLMTITIIAGSLVTIDRPIGNNYTTSAVVDKVISNMAVNGSLAVPQIFELNPPVGTIWQITRILHSIVDATAPDDGKFGGMAALANGVSIRATTEAGRTVVFANWKNNGDMKLDMFDLPYTDKAPAGNHGVNGRWTFTKSEVVAELNGDSSPVQKMEVLVQDNLTDLVSFKMRGQGRVFSP